MRRGVAEWGVSARRRVKILRLILRLILILMTRLISRLISRLNFPFNLVLNKGREDRVPSK